MINCLPCLGVEAPVAPHDALEYRWNESWKNVIPVNVFSLPAVKIAANVSVTESNL